MPSLSIFTTASILPSVLPSALPLVQPSFLASVVYFSTLSPTFRPHMAISPIDLCIKAIFIINETITITSKMHTISVIMDSSLVLVDIRYLKNLVMQLPVSFLFTVLNNAMGSSINVMWFYYISAYFDCTLPPSLLYYPYKSYTFYNQPFYYRPAAVIKPASGKAPATKVIYSYCKPSNGKAPANSRL